MVWILCKINYLPRLSSTNSSY